MGSWVQVDCYEQMAQLLAAPLALDSASGKNGSLCGANVLLLACVNDARLAWSDAYRVGALAIVYLSGAFILLSLVSVAAFHIERSIDSLPQLSYLKS
jgi:hypothetical protein